MDHLADFMNGPAGIGLGALLLAMLAVREMARELGGRRWRALVQALTIAMTPIAIIFLATLAALFLQAVR